MASFSERILELRTSHNLSQQALADAIGVSKSTISMYERGERMPSYEAQEALADYFNVDVDYLIGRHDKQLLFCLLPTGTRVAVILWIALQRLTTKKIEKFQKMMELIDDEENGHHE